MNELNPDVRIIVDYIATEAGHSDPGMADQAMEIRRLLVEAGWTPPPRVFLEGDDIPCYLPVLDHHGEVRDDYKGFDEGVDDDVYTANYDVVEMNIDYDAAIERERARRGVPNPRAHLAAED